MTCAYVVLVLLLAVFVPLSSVVVPKANALTVKIGTAVPNITMGSPPITVVSPAINIPGTTVTLTGSGWNASRSCSVTVVPEPGSGSAFFITGTSCSINGNGQLSGSFTVGANSQAGIHHLWVNDTSSPTQIVGTQVAFTVIPKIVTSPGAAVAGSPVAVYGSGFNGTTAAACTLSGTPVPSGPPNATCAEDSNGVLNGLFIVRNVAIGFYIITADDFVVSALAPFTLTGSPTAPVATFTPAFGPTGTFVTITGSNWNPSDTSVSFNETTFTSVGPLSITPVICPVSGGIIGACSFTVRSDALGGTHFVNATGTLGDKFTLQFVVLSTFAVTTGSWKER